MTQTATLSIAFRAEATAKALKMIKARQERTADDNRLSQLMRRF